MKKNMTTCSAVMTKMIDEQKIRKRRKIPETLVDLVMILELIERIGKISQIKMKIGNRLVLHQTCTELEMMKGRTLEMLKKTVKKNHLLTIVVI